MVGVFWREVGELQNVVNGKGPFLNLFCFMLEWTRIEMLFIFLE